ncbi:MAG: hypothetical protein Fur0022_04090 [Anaerolineales bacterium]
MSGNPAIKTTMHIAIKDWMAKILQNAQENIRSKEKHVGKPSLYELFLPDEIYKGATFERQFVLEFREIWKDLVVAVAKQYWGHCVKNYEVFGTIKSGRLRRIAQVLNARYSAEREKTETNTDWQTELSYVLKGKGQPIPVPVTCDIYVEDPVRHKKYAFNLLALLSDSDHPKISKEKLFKLYSMEPAQLDGAYYALSYNLDEERKDGSWDSPARWFNLKEDPVILSGDEFWERIGEGGGNQALIEAITEIGQEYKKRIYREYLGIEPPEEADLGVLS